MRDSIRDTLENLKKKEKDLNASLSTPEITSNIQKLTSLNKELSEISNIVDDYEKYLMLEKNLEEINELLLDKDMKDCLLYTSPSPRDRQKSRMPSSA